MRILVLTISGEINPKGSNSWAALGIIVRLVVLSDWKVFAPNVRASSLQFHERPRVFEVESENECDLLVVEDDEILQKSGWFLSTWIVKSRQHCRDLKRLERFHWGFQCHQLLLQCRLRSCLSGRVPGPVGIGPLSMSSFLITLEAINGAERVP